MSTPLHVHLFIPDLIWPEPADEATFTGLHCPTLAGWLARARLDRTAPNATVRAETVAETAFESQLSQLFKQPANAPFGTLRLLGETLGSGESYPNGWHCADPVHLRFHQERIILADASRLGIRAEEAEAIISTLNHEFAGRGRFHAAHPERWYFQAEGATAIPPQGQAATAPNLPLASEAPLSTVAGRRLLMQSASDPATKQLRQLQNEIQMILHLHPVNTAREEAGLSPINGLWLWGGGKLPRQASVDFDSVWSNHPLARGLACFAERDCHPVPESFATVLHEHEYHVPLLVLDPLQQATLYEDGDAWRDALHHLEMHWFAPLQQALAAGQVDVIHLYSSGIYGPLHWQITPLQRWKFWQRPQPLQHWATQLAGNSANTAAAN